MPIEREKTGPSYFGLQQILETATDGVVIIDNAGIITSFNAGAEALFGYSVDEVIGQNFDILLAEQSKGIFSNYIASLNSEGFASIFNDGREVEANVKQGGKISLFLTIGNLATPQSDLNKEQNNPTQFYVVVRDITERKKTEENLRSMKEQAEKSNAQKSLFLANISHELRTPLNAIMGFSDVMRSQRFGQIENKKYLGYARDIHSSGAHLLSLINDLLDLSKIDAGKLELNFTSVNLSEIIDDAINSLADHAKENKVTIRKSHRINLPNVVADMRSMKQVLLNLLSNAVKYTKAGGRISISTNLNKAGELHLTIKDNGSGMSKKELRQALEPFQQVGDANTNKTPGTGLGLPLAKAMVEANRASFEITSKRKKGTKVEIIFPTTRVLAE